MGKSLSQITFDFAPVEETGITAVPASTVMLKEKVIMEASKPTVVIKDVYQEPAIIAGKRGRKSLKEIAISADLIQVPEDDILFKKQYYSIGEVAVMFRENQSLIRYWETEFDILQPRKNRKGDRFFRPVDIKNLHTADRQQSLPNLWKGFIPAPLKKSSVFLSLEALQL